MIGANKSLNLTVKNHGRLVQSLGIKKNRAYFVEIKFSRHAKRRAKLYKIPESTILRILEGRDFNQRNQEIIENVEGFKYPLKIVIVVENDIITVETNYPLKKGRKG